jgi:hypothetical protein
MELLALIIGLIALGVLATRFGYDSRDGFSAMAHGERATMIGWTDPTYEQELAREIHEARERRLAHSQDAAPALQPALDDLPQAA